IAYEYITKRGAVPSFKGYQKFPASICASVNDEVVHGIPGPRVLQEGDLFSIDVGAFYRGYHGDAATTVPVGRISAGAQRLLAVGDYAAHTLADEWTIVTDDHSLAAHVEHTVAMTEHGPQILTLL